MVETKVKTPKILLGEEYLENKTVEELEKEMESQKKAQETLIKKINDQWYQEEWDKERIFDYDKNINLIYWRIKEMKKVSENLTN